MRITYITNSRLPTEKAHGIQIMKTIEAIASLGYSVELVIPNRKNPIQEDLFSFYGVKKNIEVIRLWCLDSVRFGFLGFIIEWLSFAENVFWTFLLKKRDLYM